MLGSGTEECKRLGTSDKTKKSEVLGGLKFCLEIITVSLRELAKIGREMLEI